MYINFVKNNGGNENSPSYLIKEVKYHYPNEITVITQQFPFMTQYIALRKPILNINDINYAY